MAPLSEAVSGYGVAGLSVPEQNRLRRTLSSDPYIHALLLDSYRRGSDDQLPRSKIGGNDDDDGNIDRCRLFLGRFGLTMQSSS